MPRFITIIKVSLDLYFNVAYILFQYIINLRTPQTSRLIILVVCVGAKIIVNLRFMFDIFVSSY